MGIRIGFNPSAPHAGMGERFAGPGGQGAGMPENVWGTPMVNPFATPQNQIGWQGYNPAVIAAGMPSVNTGNDNYAVPNFAPSQWGTYDMPIQSPTDYPLNPTSGQELFAFQPGQFNPFDTPFNIDNITQPAPFTGYPNQTGIPAPWVNPNVGPWGGIGAMGGIDPEGGRD